MELTSSQEMTLYKDIPNVINQLGSTTTPSMDSVGTIESTAMTAPAMPTMQSSSGYTRTYKEVHEIQKRTAPVYIFNNSTVHIHQH